MRVTFQYWNKKIQRNLIAAGCIWIAFGAFAGMAESFRVGIGSWFYGTPYIVESMILLMRNLLFEGVMLVLFINNVPPKYSLPVPFGMLAVYMGIAKGIGGLDIAMPFLFGMVVYGINIAYNVLLLDKEKNYIKKSFELYLAPQYVKELSEHPEQLKLGGEEREMTVFFSDIRSFSSFSEQLTPQQLVAVLNEYLTPMTDIVLRHKGVVDKYIGDAVMAFWGAPLDDSDHAWHAVQAALDMKQALGFVNQTFHTHGWPDIKIRIRINTGRMVVGNMGSNTRFNYTVMGDAVNLASRLEGLTKYYGAMIIISQGTYLGVKDFFVTRKLDMVAVKGKKEPVEIYEVLDVNERKVEYEPLIQATEVALSLYTAQRWDEALEAWDRVKSYKSEQLADMVMERCEQYKKQPPASGWNGGWEMSSK